ncbi:hypothetical protein B0H17DRAFT_185613, partial [Mycena rosella]
MQQESRELLYWDRPFKTVRSVGFATGDIAWFPEDRLNASYNCVNRWVSTHPDRVAIIYKADEPGGVQHHLRRAATGGLLPRQRPQVIWRLSQRHGLNLLADDVARGSRIPRVRAHWR